jgi:hypothetical protein
MLDSGRHDSCGSLLQDLARRCNLRQGVSCVVFNFDIQPHDLSQKEQAPASVLTMLDVLQCAASTHQQ